MLCVNSIDGIGLYVILCDGKEIFPLAPMGALAPGPAHARPSAVMKKVELQATQ
jgi:hypothetical protein